jgi:hypothetical protein
MDKKDYWAAHVKKNKTFKNEQNEIRITVKALHLLMMEAYDKGYEHREIVNKGMEKIFGSNEKFAEIFKDVLFDKDKNKR